MQQNDYKTKLLAQELGAIIRNLRAKELTVALDKLANSYGISKGTLSNIENGEYNCKIITLWKIAEAMGIKPSYILQLLEEKLGNDFKFFDE